MAPRGKLWPRKKCVCGRKTNRQEVETSSERTEPIRTARGKWLLRPPGPRAGHKHPTPTLLPERFQPRPSQSLLRLVDKRIMKCLSGRHTIYLCFLSINSFPLSPRRRGGKKVATRRRVGAIVAQFNGRSTAI